MIQKKEDKILLGIVGVLVIITVANAVVVFSLNSGISSKIESAKPPRLELVKIIPDCSECFDIENAVNFIKSQYNVEITSENTLEADSAEAKALINKYGIEKLPTLLIKGEISKDANLKKFFDAVGVQKDSYIVITAVPPVYVETATGKIVGKVELVNIIDNSCTECYDVSLQKQIVTGYGVFVSKDSTYDIISEEGNALVKKYNITAVPTVLLSPDAGAYETFKAVWQQIPVGTIESDGWFVFRNMNALRNITYKDLSTGKIVSTAL